MDRVNQLVGFGPSFVTFLIFARERARLDPFSGRSVKLVSLQVVLYDIA